MIPGVSGAHKMKPYLNDLHPLTVTAFLMPMIAQPSGLGLAPLLVIAGIWSLFTDARNHDLTSIFKTPLVPLLAGFLTYALISSLWAPDMIRALRTFLLLAVGSCFGLALLHQAKAVNTRDQQRIGNALLIGMFFGILALFAGYIYGKITGIPLWGGVDEDPARKLSHAATVLNLMFWPTAQVLYNRRAFKTLIALASVIIILFYLVEHSASLSAMLISGLAFFMIRQFGIKAIKPIALLAGMSIFTMPFLTELIPSFDQMISMANENGVNPASFHRLFIWRFATDNIWTYPWLGWGLDASRNIPGAKELILWGIETMPLHPHNEALQVWLELGAAGAIAVTVIVYKILSRTGSAFNLAYAVSYLIYAMLSYGAWQGWWFAAAWLVAALMTATSKKAIPSAHSPVKN